MSAWRKYFHVDIKYTHIFNVLMILLTMARTLH